MSKPSLVALDIWGYYQYSGINCLIFYNDYTNAVPIIVEMFYFNLAGRVYCYQMLEYTAGRNFV